MLKKQVELPSIDDFYSCTVWLLTHAT